MIKPSLRSPTLCSRLKIGLLGGSFNPAHDGHLAMSLYALKQLGLDQIWWLVSPQNPLKPAADMARLSKRLARASVVANHPKLVITDIECQMGTRFTADTLRILKKRFPHTHFVWLMGADNLKQIPRWKDWEKIFSLVPVAVFRRPAYPAGRGLGKAPIRFAKSWRRASAATLLATSPQPGWIILDNKLNYTSATKIRKDDPSWQV